MKDFISVVIPFHNEKENLPVLLPDLKEKLKKLGVGYEIVLVDDGSLDDYRESLQPHLDHETRLVVLNRQMGKGRALTEGLKDIKGNLIVFMDADLQDDPADLSGFYEKVNKGFDLVNGFRFDRKDNPIIKIYSKSARWFLQHFLSSPFSDINCGFKMFRKEVLKEVVLYGNNFRFLPLAAFYEGFRVGEVKVHNKPRLHGKSKYGMRKLFIGLIDMLSAYFLYKFSERPLHFFGSIGALLFVIGGLALAWVTYERIFEGVLLYRRPALQYAIFLVILGIQIIMTGIVGELIVYLHHKKKLS
ncbi:glycosyltransferase family 2 protein [Candidatus Roizmanbacteria bacterium]|nr:MAG: glycosyltransferase family 2 protein [Candidatus Roizmanbacteria bacterium]